VEVAFGGSPVAEEGDDHLVLLAAAGGVGGADGAGYLGGHRNGDGQVAGAGGCSPAFVIEVREVIDVAAQLDFVAGHGALQQ
jgi:hypothetical protein